MRSLRGAILGCGMVSAWHLQAWQRIEEVEIVALVDHVPAHAERRRSEFFQNAHVYATLEQLLSHESLDFIDILTPPALHKEHCLQALHAGLNVICQKPMSDNLSDARELVSAFAQAKRSLAIHENHRYREWYREIVSRARQGFFGKICYARFEQMDAHAPAESYKLEAPTGILLEYGTHVIDMIHALMGRPTHVFGSANHIHPGVTGESLVQAALMFPEATVTMDLAWKPSGIPSGSVTIVGDEGEAVFTGFMTRGEYARFRLIQNRTTVLDQERSPCEDFIDSFEYFQREVIDAWQNQKPVPQSASSNLEVLETTFAIYRAISSGQVVSTQ